MLSDPKKKSRYDSGQDLEDDGMNMGGQCRRWTLGSFLCSRGVSLTNRSSVLSLPDFDANNIFKAFFGGPGGFSFEGNFYLVYEIKKHYQYFCYVGIF